MDVRRAASRTGRSVTVGLGLCLLDASAATQCEVEQLYAGLSGAGDSFGQSLDFDEDELVVGSRYSATVFARKDPGTPLDDTDDDWVLEDYLLGQHIWDAFGSDVSLDGDHLLVGAPDWSLGLAPGGRAYVFVRDDRGTPEVVTDDTWSLQSELVPPTGDIGAFGASVALDGDWLAVGDWMGTAVAGSPLPHSGFVLLARREDGGTPSDPGDDQWATKALLEPGEGAAYFGAEVDLCGNELLVFALQPLGTGRVFRYRLDDASTPKDLEDDSWVQNGEIPAPAGEATGLHGALARDGNSLLIGGDEAAFEYRLDDGGTPQDPRDDDWLLAGIVEASDDTPFNDDFGGALSLRGGRALVGAKTHNHSSGSGAVYLFQRDEPAVDPRARWTQVVELLPPPGSGAKKFGHAVGLAGDVAFVGESGFFQFIGPADSTYGQCRVYAMSEEPWSYVGSPLPSSTWSSPCLVGAGALEPDSVATLAIERGPPLAPAAIVLGSQLAQVPYKGGTLVPLPQLVAWITTSAGGEAFVSGRWPSTVPRGFMLWAQVWMLDDAGPAGFSATNAVRGDAAR